MPKPCLPPFQIESMLRRRWGDVAEFSQLAEGLASQAFGFRTGAGEYVVRINQSIEGFEKDCFVSRRFASPALPIPEVLEVGQFDGGHAFCISHRAPGVRLHDVESAGLARMVAPVARVMAAVGASNLESTRGFGRFDACGIASYATWGDFLTGVSDSRRFDWGAAGRSTDIDVVSAAIRLVKEFANLFFWHETRLEPLIHHFASQASLLPRWRERLLCYQLRIGLQEIYESALQGGPCDVGWLTARCADIIEQMEQR